jgi:hypothetical protein
MPLPPKLTTVVYVRLAAEDMAELREIAAEECIAVSSVVRRIVRRELRQRAKRALHIVEGATAL